MITLIFTILCAIYDNGKRFTNHSIRFIFRALIIAFISYFESKDFIINFAFNTAIFYFLFDYILNILEKRKWNYIGSTSKIDLFFKWFGWQIQLVFKLIFLTITFLIWI